MKDFDKHFDDFDKDFARTKRWVIIYGIFSLLFGLGLTGFVIWVIIVLLQFFSVI